MKKSLLSTAIVRTLRTGRPAATCGAALLLIAGALPMAAPARAAIVTDTSLVAPGVYYGTGNGGTNSHWVVDTTTDLELGLNTLIRYVGPVTPTAGNVYTVPLGDTTVPGKTGSAWGYAFSARGIGGLLLGGFDLSLSVTDNFQGSTSTIDPKLIPDNAGTNGTSSVGGGNGCAANPTAAACAPATRTGLQNSETLSYLFQDPLYNSAVNDTFTITLTASIAGVQVAQVSEIINTGTGAPVPEPVSLALFGAGVAGLGLVRRGRGRSSSTKVFTGQ